MITEPEINPSYKRTYNMEFPRLSEEWWGKFGSETVKRCTAHRKNGLQCKHIAMHGTNVCQTHGGKAPQVKRRARQRLEEAADRMARNLLGLAETADTDGVKLAATNSALDRAGITAKTSVSVEVSTKPFELVFDSIMSERPDDSAGELEPRSEPALAGSDDDAEIVGEYDDDPPEDDEDGYREPERERERRPERDSDSVVDVEIEDPAYEDAQIMNTRPGVITPTDSDSAGSVDQGDGIGPLGGVRPHNFGLMSLAEANEAAAAMNRNAARLRAMRRR